MNVTRTGRGQYTVTLSKPWSRTAGAILLHGAREHARKQPAPQITYPTTPAAIVPPATLRRITPTSDECLRYLAEATKTTRSRFLLGRR